MTYKDSVLNNNKKLKNGETNLLEQMQRKMIFQQKINI